MRRDTTYLLVVGAVGVVLAVLVGAWFLFSPSTKLERAGQIDTAEISGTGILDGMTFSGVMGATEDRDEVKDNFVFANGTFMSTECDRRCGYPARPYFVRHVGEKIEFFSESNCLYKDAKIVWRGTVENGTIRGMSNWTVNRWYWTIEKESPFEGTLKESADSVASNR